MTHILTQAQTVHVFEDKAAFFAATGATGPLSNAGVVADSSNPTGSRTVGSISFSLAAGGNNLYIGTTEPAPRRTGYASSGNDIALGYENLRVRTASPVFSLGFDIVDPDANLWHSSVAVVASTSSSCGAAFHFCSATQRFIAHICNKDETL